MRALPKFKCQCATPIAQVCNETMNGEDLPYRSPLSGGYARIEGMRLTATIIDEVVSFGAPAPDTVT
jgi:hypothetical protein